MTAPTVVFDIAQDILAAVVTGYAANSISLPSRRYVADGGEVALDCELVAVALGRVFRGSPNSPADSFIPQRCVGIRTAEFHVWIVRCASAPQDSGDPPSTATIESFSELMMTDAWFLPYALAQSVGAGNLGSCDEMFIGDLTVQGPQGAFVGVDLIVQHQLG